MAQRKVGFFYLHSVNGEVNLDVQENLLRLLSFIDGLTNTQKKRDITRDKICFLDSYDYNENNHIVKILFKSAVHSYRAPLLNRNTIELRENPKTIEEGEQVKTHLLVKYVNGDAIVFLETGRGLLTLKTITEYLNIFILIHNNNSDNPICGHFTLDIIPRDDFREVLQNMDRVLLAQIYTDKQILGSDSLNFSDRTENVQEDIVIELKTKRQQSIKSVLYDVLSKMNGNREDIKRVRIKGKMPNNTDCMIDTDFLMKKEYIDVVQNEETGEFHTADMFNQLELLSNSF